MDSFKEMPLNLSSAMCWPFMWGVNMFITHVCCLWLSLGVCNLVLSVTHIYVLVHICERNMFLIYIYIWYLLLLPLLHHIVHLNDEKMKEVASQCPSPKNTEIMPTMYIYIYQIVNIWVFKYGANHSTTMKHVYNQSKNFINWMLWHWYCHQWAIKSNSNGTIVRHGGYTVMLLSSLHMRYHLPAGISGLIDCGLLISYGIMELAQHWFRQWLVAWWHKAITLTKVDFSSVRYWDLRFHR